MRSACTVCLPELERTRFCAWWDINVFCNNLLRNKFIWSLNKQTFVWTYSATCENYLKKKNNFFANHSEQALHCAMDRCWATVHSLLSKVHSKVHSLLSDTSVLYLKMYVNMNKQQEFLQMS